MYPDRGFKRPLTPIDMHINESLARRKISLIRASYLPSILLRSALWRSGFSSANFLRSTFAQTMNAFIGRRIRCSLRLLWAVPPPGWHIFTPAGIGEMPCWYSNDGPEVSQGMSSSRCCAGPLSMLGIWKRCHVYIFREDTFPADGVRRCNPVVVFLREVAD